MLRDIEVFLPTLFPAMLEGANTAPARPALTDLNLAAFSGASREELAMAERRLGEAARTLVPAGKTVTSAKLAVLAAPYEGFRNGTLAYVQETDGATVAYLASGTRVDAASGSVRIRRTVISLTPHVPLRKAMATGNKTVDTILKLADMAKAKLPGPVGTAISVVTALVDLFTSGGPSEAEIIVEAIQKAITAAVAELESFIVDEKIKDIQSAINNAYRWIKEAAAQTKRAATTAAQAAYARRALSEMEEHITGLKQNLDRLTLVAVPGDVGKSLHERTKAAKLLAHGAAALFTLHKLRLQFDAFLAINESDAKLKEQHTYAVQSDCVAFKNDVFGDDRSFPLPATGDPVDGSFILAYDEMAQALIRDRLACLVVHAPYFVFGGKLVDPYRGIDNDINPGDWKNCMEGAGLPYYRATSFAEREAQTRDYISAIMSAYIADEGLQDNTLALGKYLNLVRDWDKEATSWNDSMLQPQARIAS